MEETVREDNRGGGGRGRGSGGGRELGRNRWIGRKERRKEGRKRVNDYKCFAWKITVISRSFS